MHFIKAFWDSMDSLGHAVTFLDYAGVVDVVAAVILLIIWLLRPKGERERLFTLWSILLSICAGLLWVSDSRFSHRLADLQEQRNGEEKTQEAASINALSKQAEDIVRKQHDEGPRTFPDDQKEYATNLLGKYRGTPFVLESFADPESARFGRKLSDLLANSGWGMVGSASGDRETIQGITSEHIGYPMMAEPSGIVIEVNHPEQLQAASALDLLLHRWGMKSRVSFDPHPALVIGGDGIHLRVGTKD